MSEMIPEGWRLEPLASCITESTAGEWGNEANGDKNDVPVLRSTNFTDSGKIDYRNIVFRNIEERKRIKKALSKGDVLLEKSGGGPTQPVGRIVYFERDTPYLFSNFTQKLVVRAGNDSKYVFYKLLSEYQNGTVLKFQQQTTGIINFQLAEYLTHEILLAPLPEQQKIAAVLSSTDDMIEKTRAQIDKLKDLKTGMMQELLTQGIGHTEFKDSPVGRIPQTWSVIKVQELLADTKYALRSGPFGSALLKSELVPSGIPLLGIDNVHAEELRSIFKRFVSVEKFQELEKYAVFPGDLMVTIMGTVGRCCVVPENFGEALSSKHVWTLTLKREKYIPQLLCWQINFSDWVKKQFLNESQGGVMESISSSTLKGLMVPLPPFREQKKIADVHTSLSERTTRKEDQLRSLINLKKALMQDLLTGKVRVKLDSPEVAAA